MSPTAVRILDFCREISVRENASLAVHEEIYSALDPLLEAATPQDTAAVLSDPEFMETRDHLHRIRARYEFAREYEVAKRVLELADDGPSVGFRSADMYDAAVHFETALINAETPRSVLFIGAGPFPITSIAYARMVPDARVVCIDNDTVAQKMADAIARKLKCGNLEVQLGDGVTDPDFAEFDVVVVGLMIGVTDHEKAIAARRILARSRPKRALFFRSAVGAGRVIWPRLDLKLPGNVVLDPVSGGPENTFALVRAR